MLATTARIDDVEQAELHPLVAGSGWARPQVGECSTNVCGLTEIEPGGAVAIWITVK